MPTFATPQPLDVEIEVVGDVRIAASDRSDTVVTVRPGDPVKAADVRAADQTVVEHTDGRLLVKTPRSWRQFTPFGGTESVDVTIEVPSGSRVVTNLGLGHVSTSGRLGACRLKTGLGDIRVDRSGALRAASGLGDVTADHVDGDADLRTGSGTLRAGTVLGTAEVKNSNGDTAIGSVAGDLQVKAANGDIAIGRAQSSVSAKSANGDIHVDEVRRGTVVLETSVGEVEVGIRPGTAAWLDASSKFGRVHNTLDEAPGPPPTGDRVQVRARTAMGDIVIVRSTPDPAPAPDGAEPTTATADRSDPR